MDQLSPEEQAALEALKSLPRHTASGDVRERTRALFVEGRPRLGSIEGKGRRPGWFWPMALAAAAAIIILGVIYVGGQPVTHWYEMASGEILRPGPLATGPGIEKDVQLGDRLRFRMLESTEIELPSPPGRWFGKTRTLQLTGGEIYGTTSSEGLGFALRIETPEAIGLLYGTTFATFRTEEGTCFCLWSGSLEVTPAHGSEPVRVPVEHKFYVYTDGTTSEILPIDDRERMKLSMTQDAGLTPIPSELP